MTDMKIKSHQVAELQELITMCGRSVETLTKTYTVLLEQHLALGMVTGVLVGAVGAGSPDFVPRMIAGLEKICAEKGIPLTSEQLAYLASLAGATVAIEPGEAGTPKGVVTH